MQRITESQLQKVCDRINRETNSPAESYGPPKTPAERLQYTGGYVPQVGNYHLSFQCGGVSLHRHVKGGGITDVLRIGHVTKRELYNAMHAYLQGMSDVNGH